MYWKFLLMLLLSTVKLMFVPPVAYAAGMGYWLTLLATTSGSALGFAVFFFLSASLLRSKRPLSKRNIKRARRIITMRQKYHTWMFLILLPFLSVPGMAVVVRKVYARSRKMFFASIGVLMLWSVMLCLVYLPVLKAMG